MAKYANGKFTPKNGEKYNGTRTPTYRSSWELHFMNFCDSNPNILQWSSESIKIPYRNPFTGKSTVYVPDFFILYADAQGRKHGELIEVKPRKETSLHEAGKSKRAQAAAILNAAKWEAAKAWCKRQHVRFRIITEDDLFHQGKRKK